MKANASDIADFYQQLALLIKSNLPLPDSLRELGHHFPESDFQEAILDVSELTAGGERFSEAVKKYPRFFRPFHVQLLSAGEASGTLPEILLAVARFSRFGQIMAVRMRDVLSYPLFVIHLLIFVTTFEAIYVFPFFTEFYTSMGGRLPFITRFMIGVSSFACDTRWFVFIAYPMFLVFSLWLFTPGLIAQRAMLGFINILPAARGIVHSLDSARLCGMWSILLKTGMPLPTAMDTATQLAEHSSIRKALARIARKLKAGDAAAEAMSCERPIDSLIVLVFKHAPEEELPAELERLGHLFEYRVALQAKLVTVTWTVIGFVLMTLLVGTFVFGMFLPIFKMGELVL